MAAFDPIPTMSFTKWFSIMDYAVSLGFKMTEIGIHITNIANSDILKGNERIGLCGIKSSDNGTSVSHVIGWDMEDQLRYNNSTMRNVLDLSEEHIRSSMVNGSYKVLSCLH